MSFISYRICPFILVATLSVWGSFAGEPATAATLSKTTYTLESSRCTDAIDRVVCVFEASGMLKIPHEKDQSTKLGMKAALVYDERTLDVPDTKNQTLRAARYYDRADAKILLPDGDFAPNLRAERCLMGVAVDDTQITIFSPKGSITRDELDLVDLPANSLLIDRFLPTHPVAQGESWTCSNDLISAALGIDRTTKQTVECTLAKIDDKTAVVELGGRIDGSINGVTTRIEIKGKYRFDRKTRRIDWFGLLVHEDRDPGHVGPGLDVTARLRMQIEPREDSDKLSDKVIKSHSFEPSDETTQLVYEPKRGGWQFGHDRRWFFTGGTPPLAFLRLIEQGDFIAQCNVVELEPVEPGKQATLERFQDDIKQALGEAFGEFVSASQKANEQNYRVLRVVVRGTISELPIEWHYYLVADEHGRQVTFTFTVEGPLAKRLGKQDEQMVASLRFDPPQKVAAKAAETR